MKSGGLRPGWRSHGIGHRCGRDVRTPAIFAKNIDKFQISLTVVKGSPIRTQQELAMRKKGDRKKLKIARRLRRQTTVTWQWIADRLQMGAAGHVAGLCYDKKS
jgi:hypothetical protein